MTDPCMFCRIVSGEIPVQIVDQTAGAIAFPDISPQAPVHVLVIPKKHIDSLAAGIDEETLGHLLSFAAAVAMTEGIAESGYRTVINTGNDGGQTVGHLHVHLLGGRAMKWPPG